jgi:hypothetical protein
MLGHVSEVRLAGIPAEFRQVIVVADPVVVASLVARSGPQAAVRLEHEHGDGSTAAPGAIPQGDVEVALALALVRVPGEHLAEAEAARGVDAGHGADPAAGAGLVRPVRDRLPFLVLAARRVLGGEQARRAQ